MKEDTLVYGYNPVVEALKAGREIEKIFLQSGMMRQRAGIILDMASKRNIPVQFVPAKKLHSITGKNHQGVIAIASVINYHPPEELLMSCFEKGKTPFFLLLDGITDVRNFGAIVRSAECAGADAIIIPVKGSAQISADAVRTSAGALHHVPIARSGRIPELIGYFRDSGVHVVAASEDAGKAYYEADFNRPTLLIMGAEDKGVSPQNLQMADESVKIPMKGKTGSLNVSVAAGILVFEAMKQRNQAGL